MSKKLLRRRFLQGTTAGGALLASRSVLLEQPLLAKAAKAPAPSDRLRMGIIGIGMQGSGLLHNAIQLPGIECVAAADLYDGRHTLSKEITGNTSLPTTRRYHELLERKDIDCLIAAVPDFWHKQVVVDACNAGKDIYCEKPMSHTAEEGFAMVEAAQTNKRIVQIGSQRVSSELCRKAREMYLQGAIGEIRMVELSLGRNSPNGAWVYPPPPDLSLENLDWNTWLKDTPKIPLDPFRFARWRCWKEYGTGVGGDLMVHLLSGMLFTLDWNEPPRSATALAGIYRFKDARDMPDLHTVLFDYHTIPVYVRLSLVSETPELALFLGSKGVLEASGTTLKHYPQSGEDEAPSYYTGSFPHKLRAEYVEQWNKEHNVTPGKSSVDQTAEYKGNDWDDVSPHLWNFFEAVKSRKEVAENGVFGNHAAIACHMANESYFKKCPVKWNAGDRRINS
jgi:predicted dehydrogenase